MISQSLLIVAPPTPPDLDGVACAIAYADLLNQIGIRAEAWFCGQPDGEARYVLSQCKNVTLATDQTVQKCDKFVLVDGSELVALPREMPPDAVSEVIDHRLHRHAKTYFPNAAIDIEAVGAAATLIAERFSAKNIVPSADSGMLMYSAIISNTQRLKGSVTTNRDIEMAQWLTKHVSIPDDLIEGQFEARRQEIMDDLSAAIVRESKLYQHSTGEYIIAQLELEQAEDLIRSDLPALLNYTSILGRRAMLNLVDIASGRSHLIIPDTDFRRLVEETTGMKFDSAICETDPIVLRKQIMASMEGMSWD